MCAINCTSRFVSLGSICPRVWDQGGLPGCPTHTPLLKPGSFVDAEAAIQNRRLVFVQ